MQPLLHATGDSGDRIAVSFVQTKPRRAVLQAALDKSYFKSKLTNALVLDRRGVRVEPLSLKL